MKRLPITGRGAPSPSTRTRCELSRERTLLGSVSGPPTACPAQGPTSLPHLSGRSIPSEPSVHTSSSTASHLHRHELSEPMLHNTTVEGTAEKLRFSVPRRLRRRAAGPRSHQVVTLWPMAETRDGRPGASSVAGRSWRNTPRTGGAEHNCEAGPCRIKRLRAKWCPVQNFFSAAGR